MRGKQHCTARASASGVPSKHGTSMVGCDPSATPGCAPRLTHTPGQPPTAGALPCSATCASAPLQRLSQSSADRARRTKVTCRRAGAERGGSDEC
eukprot:4227269-Prymnesium_polylepis.1